MYMALYVLKTIIRCYALLKYTVVYIWLVQLHMQKIKTA